MFQQSPHKTIGIGSFGQFQESSRSLDASNNDISLRIELPKGFGSSKLNKNIIKLSPLGLKKTYERIESIRPSIANEEKAQILVSDGESQNIDVNKTVDHALNTEPIPADASDRLESLPDVDHPSLQNISASNRKKIPQNPNPIKITMGLREASIRNKGQIQYRLSDIQKASSFSEARLMMVGLPSSTKSSEENNKDSGFNELVKSTNLKMEKSRDMLQLPPIDSSNGIPALKKNHSAPPELDSFRKLVFSPRVDQKLLQKYAKQLLKGLNYSLKLLKPPPLRYVQLRQISVGENKKNQKTLLLDLDETLISACMVGEKPDKVLPLVGEEVPSIGIKIRPYTREFLREMKEHYEIFIYTASAGSYAEAVVKELDPENKYISYVLDRTYCLQTKNGFFIKDLRIIKNRELKNMIMVDNLVHSFGFQIENGVPILEWRGDTRDEELKYLMGYLKEAKMSEDVREYNREKLRLTELVNIKFDEESEKKL